MAYHHEQFQFPMEHSTPGNMFFHQPPQFTQFLPQQTPDIVYQQYPFPEYAELMRAGVMLDDFDDPTEISTRPRLTKEQVEVLESQFQAHPKPNSMVKKQLAMQTKLTLPRVANWFQNRRAKAKQQKKQEEYENQQSSDNKSEHQSGQALPPDDVQADIEHATETKSSPAKQSSSGEVARCSTSAPESPVKSESMRESDWLQLQRTLEAATAAQRQRKEEDHLAMPPPEMFSSAPVNHVQAISQPIPISAKSALTEWSKAKSAVGVWSPSPTIDAAGFDFGFDNEAALPKEDTADQNDQAYLVSTEEWPASYFADAPSAGPNSYKGLVSPPLPIPTYPSSRRGSGAEDLAHNLGTFALGGTPPTAASVGHMSSPLQASVDLASRRKRPRPAALTSASLRSRSYGAMSATSPSFRSMPSNSGGQLRQVKSTGHGLNSHYAGVRKQSIPQKSPLNISTFAEAEAQALNCLLAQQVASKTPTPADHVISSDMNDPNPGIVDISQLQQPPPENVLQYKQVQSPPVTPFQNDFLLHSSTSMHPPPTSAQYATFADYTPPYSAGPLTNSTCSWSDAPLRSPDLPNFSSGTFMSSLAFNHQDPSFQQWILSSDNPLDSSSQKKTEFFITEFPGQREEHATVAQHITTQKPKNYVFANTVPCDYDI